MHTAFGCLRTSITWREGACYKNLITISELNWYTNFSLYYFHTYVLPFSWVDFRSEITMSIINISLHINSVHIYTQNWTSMTMIFALNNTFPDWNSVAMSAFPGTGQIYITSFSVNSFSIPSTAELQDQGVLEWNCEEAILYILFVWVVLKMHIM